MGNIKTEKRKRNLKRKKLREAEISLTLLSVCKHCGNSDKTIDETGICNGCRREECERECWIDDFT
jgi:hypothetical protein